MPDPKSDSPPDICNGTRAYAHRQSHLYDDLVTSFISHWRPYLSAQSLGSSWLDGYASHVGLTPTPSSQRADARLPPVSIHIPMPPIHCSSSQLPVDPPLLSESDHDSDWGDELNTGGDIDEAVDTEDILDDD